MLATVDRFDAWAQRAANLIAYGATRDEVREALRADGAPDDLILCAYVAAQMIVESQST
ncbi:MAG TPA: hypothetical protein VIG47_08700 [Gemmatimonadaceae bacterium]|jgi:hypothetical protein